MTQPEKAYKQRIQGYQPFTKIWLRFIDDIIMIWQFGRLELEEFLKALNNHHQKIKFTYTIDQNEYHS